jgi:hypothetical protein
MKRAVTDGDADVAWKRAGLSAMRRSFPLNQTSDLIWILNGSRWRL